MHPDTVYVNLLNDSNSWLPLASLLVALAAVVVAPWVQWHIAKNQFKISWNIIRSQVKSESRQQWLNDVRSSVASHMHLTTTLWIACGRSGNPFPIESEELKNKMLALEHQLDLYLNSNEPSQKKLLENLEATNVASESNDPSEFVKSLNNLRDSFYEVRDSVWNEIKEGI